MSGHNKWSKIKNKKGSEDAKKEKSSQNTLEILQWQPKKVELILITTQL